MRRLFARALQFVLPARCWTLIYSVRARNHEFRWLKDQGFVALGKQFSESNGDKVVHGPFKGMTYPTESIVSRHSVPKLLGSYESELHEIIGNACNERYAVIVDIGCAEGYYAVGLALKAKAPVIAFDTDFREARRCKSMARLNGVADRVSVRGWCSGIALRRLTGDARCFVLSDCEGYEAELFDEATVSSLRLSDVLIELHGDIHEMLASRFSKTHEVRIVISSDRSAADYPELQLLGADGDRAINENRSGRQRWLYAASRCCLR